MRIRQFTIVLVVGVLTVLLVPAFAHAQTEDGGGGGNTNQYTLSQSAYRQITQLQKLLGEKKYDQVIARGKSMLPSVKRESPYAEALVNEMIANAYLVQNKLNEAAPYLKTIVRLDALQPSTQRSIIQELATVYLANKKYGNAIRLYQQVLAQDAKHKVQPGPELYYRLGLAYSYRGDANHRNSDYATALKYIKRAIHMAEQLHAKDPKKNDAPSKDWYQAWFVVAYKMKDFKQAQSVAKLLVAKWPDNKDFWNYYANTALLMHEDGLATAVYGIMYKKGMLKSKDDYLQLASLLLEEKAPYKAAEILSDGMTKGIIPKTKGNYETLSGAWISARAWNKALAVLGQEAQASPDGKVYLRQAQIYINRRNYAKARQAAQNAINRGGLGKETGSAWMTLGQAAFEQKDYTAAIQAFRKAAQYKSQARDARSWIKYVQVSRKQSG